MEKARKSWNWKAGLMPNSTLGAPEDPAAGRGEKQELPSGAGCASAITTAVAVIVITAILLTFRAPFTPCSLLGTFLPLPLVFSGTVGQTGQGRA